MAFRVGFRVLAVSVFFGGLIFFDFGEVVRGLIVCIFIRVLGDVEEDRVEKVEGKGY